MLADSPYGGIISPLLFLSLFGKYPNGKIRGVGILKNVRYAGPVIIFFPGIIFILLALIEKWGLSALHVV